MQPTPRQVSPLPREVQAQKILSVKPLRYLAQWNEHAPKVLTKGASAFASTLIPDNGNGDKVYGSIYIPRVSPRESSFIRRSARLASIITPRSIPCTPLGTFFSSKHQLTPAQSSQIVIDCPEIDAVYCISTGDWECERRHRRIFERDFPRYNHELQYCDLDELSNFGPEAWDLIKVSQENYVPDTPSDSDASLTPGLSTDESELEACSDTDLFGYTVTSHGP